MLLLFGGGFAIGGAFQDSELSSYFGGLMARWVDLPFAGIVLSISLATTFLTEVTSNTASMHVLMPILREAAQQGGIAPIHMMLPAVLSVSCAFMLPVATAPNAIVFGTGKVSIRSMIRCGFVLNLVGVLVVLLVTLMTHALDWMPGAGG
jgi:sodium-dependent dicarboxylate transporter 2/3/5